MNAQTTTAEASVICSLAKLAHLEEERLQEEAEQRAARDHQASLTARKHRQARQTAEQARRAEEEARRMAAEQKRAESHARAVAHERAAVDTARIEAASKAHLEAEGAIYAHELEKLRLGGDRNNTRLRRALMAAVALIVAGGLAAGWRIDRHFTEVESATQQLREDRSAATRSHERTLASLYAAFQSLHEMLEMRDESAVTVQERARAEERRDAIEANGADRGSLISYGRALNALAQRTNLASRLVASDRRRADLSRWAQGENRQALLARLRTASALAHHNTTDSSMREYELALDQVGLQRIVSTTKPKRPAGGARTSTFHGATTEAPAACANPEDPLCGLDGQWLDTR